MARRRPRPPAQNAPADGTIILSSLPPRLFDPAIRLEGRFDPVELNKAYRLFLRTNTQLFPGGMEACMWEREREFRVQVAESAPLSSRCTCSFFQTHGLPCRHVFAAVMAAGVIVVDEELGSCIAPAREQSQTVARSGTSTATSSSTHESRAEASGAS